MRSSLANTFAAAGFNWVGDQTAAGKWDLKDGSLGKIGLHAVMGGLAAEAAGGDFKTGALAAGINEALVGALSAQYDKLGVEDKAALLTMNSQVIGVLTAAAQGGDEKALQTGSWVASSATSYNYLNHEEMSAQRDELERCDGSRECMDKVGDKYYAIHLANEEKKRVAGESGSLAENQRIAREIDDVKLNTAKGLYDVRDSYGQSIVNAQHQRNLDSSSSSTTNVAAAHFREEYGVSGEVAAGAAAVFGAYVGEGE